MIGNNSINRIFWADNLKGFLILLVVLGHSIQYSVHNYGELHIFNYIYSFHMPLFMAISGFVSYKESSLVELGGIKRSIIQLLMPYVLWTWLLVSFSDESLINRMILSPFYWFLILLFIIRVLMICCQQLSVYVNQPSEIICFIAVIILFMMHGLIDTNIFSINILHVHFLFYTIGWYTRKNETKILKKSLLLPVCVCFILTGWFYQQNTTPFISIVPPSFYFILSGLVGSFFWTSIFRIFINMRTSILMVIGKLTLGIYVIHLLICFFAEDYFNQWVGLIGETCGIITVFLVLSAVSISLCMLLKRNRFTKYIV